MLIAVAILLLVFVLPPAVGIAVLVAAIALEALEVVFWLRFLRRYRISTGAEGMVGEVGVIADPCRPEGTVRLRGEIWRARCPGGAAPGETVKVTAVDGLTLEVEPQAHLPRTP
jgi:membrane-bound serine protease (ClpP class)